ncbi:MAG: hypothetical protein AAAFM81_10375 [Pseudomonadota bacterium]
MKDRLRWPKRISTKKRKHRSAVWLMLCVTLPWSVAATAGDPADCIQAVEEGQANLAVVRCQNLKSDSAENQYALAFFYLYGLIGEERLQQYALLEAPALSSTEIENIDRSHDLLESAADSGHVDAQFLLAVVLGLSRPDLSKTLASSRLDQSDRRYKQAANADHPAANYHLGMRALNLWSPLGVVIEQPEYEDYLQRASELGIQEATDLLRQARANEARFSHVDTLSADDKEKLAANLWHSDEAGPPAQAIALMEQAAAEGSINAMSRLANHAWPQDRDRAERFLLMGLKKRDPGMMRQLGNFHACLGNGMIAKDHFDQAAMLGDKEAGELLKELKEWGVDGWLCESL